MEEKKYSHISFDDIFLFLNDEVIPSHHTTKAAISNFKRQCGDYSVIDGRLYKRHTNKKTGAVSNLEVLRSVAERHKVIEMLHCGSAESPEAIALSSHRGREKTRELVAERYYWHTITKDVRAFVQQCVPCQKVDPSGLKVNDL